MTTAVAMCALAGVALAACTGSESGSSSGGADSGRADSGRAVRGAVSGGVAHAGPAAAPSATANSGAGSAGSSVAESGGTEVSAAHLMPQLILTGSLSVVVGLVGRAASRAESITAGVGGRTDADHQDSARGSRPSAQLTLRVPNEAVPSVLVKLAALGHRTDEQLSTRDVTTQVADVTSRVASARSAIGSLRALYAKATKVGDIIRIESSLSEREASLESLEARQRSLSRQVALATISLALVAHKAAAAPPVKRPAQRGGFVGGLDRGWHAFTAVVSGLALSLGAALPFLLVLAVVALLALGVRRRLRPRGRPVSEDV